MSTPPRKPNGSERPYVWIEVTYLKVRRDGRISSVALTSALAAVPQMARRLRRASTLTAGARFWA